MKKTIQIVLSILGLILVGIQFVPVDRTNPPVVDEISWDSPETRELAKRACFDCHSNETVWPWYAYVAPISFRVAGHVDHGRQHLNFSDWSRPNEDFDEIEEVIEEGDMPLSDYLMMHEEADLTAEETQRLLDGLRATYAQDPPVPRRRGPPPANQGD